MRSKIFVILTSLIIGLSMTFSSAALAGSDLPTPPKVSDLPKPGDLPKPTDLPKPGELPGVKAKNSRWWDPLGLFDHNDGHKGKHKKKKK